MDRTPSTLAGFRVILRRPSFALAEIAWRWSFGAALVAALLFCFKEYLGTLPVNPVEMFLLGSRQPVLIGRAVGQIFSGSAPRLIASLIVLAIVFTLAWAILASFGRATVVRALAAQFQSEFRDQAQANLPSGWGFSSLFGIHLLRASAALAMVVGSLGAWVVAANIASQNPALIGVIFNIVFSVCFLAAASWIALNWFLSFAAIFIVTDSKNIREAISAAAELCTERFGRVVIPGIWFVIGRGLAGIVALAMCILIASSINTAQIRIVLALLVMFVPVYWLMADWLYMARLAAYVSLIKGLPDNGVRQEMPWTGPLIPRQQGSRVDPDELILSDLPGV